MGARARPGAPALLVALCGLCCAALMFVRRPTSARPTALLAQAAPSAIAQDITAELFGPGLDRAAARQRSQLAALRQHSIAGVVRLAPGFPLKRGMMLDDGDEEGDEAGDEEGGEEGDSQDDEYARFVWRKERLEDEGVNVDAWLAPDLLDRIGYSDRPYTAGHHPADENITNATTQFFADDWPLLNETTNSTWIDDEDFRWNSPYDYVGARPLEADHHPVAEVLRVHSRLRHASAQICFEAVGASAPSVAYPYSPCRAHPQHHHVKFLPGVNINSNPLCGQELDGTPLDCGESEWWV
jgi:hypothetical protein